MTASTAPARLTVDHLTAPTGVAVEHPVLGWQPAAADTRTPTHVEIEVRRLAPTGQPLDVLGHQVGDSRLIGGWPPRAVCLRSVL